MATKKGTKVTAAEKEAIKNRTLESEKNAKEMGRNVVSAKAQKKNTTGLRVGAFALWAVGLALEIVAILILNGTIAVPAAYKLYAMIGCLVADMIAVINDATNVRITSDEPAYDHMLRYSFDSMYVIIITTILMAQ